MRLINLGTGGENVRLKIEATAESEMTEAHEAKGLESSHSLLFPSAPGLLSLVFAFVCATLFVAHKEHPVSPCSFISYSLPQLPFRSEADGDSTTPRFTPRNVGSSSGLHLYFSSSSCSPPTLQHFPCSPICDRLLFATPCRSSIPAFASRHENTHTDAPSPLPSSPTQHRPSPLSSHLIFDTEKSSSKFIS
jgi:hypothetical protein